MAGRLATIDTNEPFICQMAIRHPAVLPALACALNELPSNNGQVSGAESSLSSGFLQEAVVEALVSLTNGSSLKLRILLANEQMLVPRLLRLIAVPNVAPHVARRATQVLVNLADSPECHDALRQHVRSRSPPHKGAFAASVGTLTDKDAHHHQCAQEWMMMHMALHDSQVAAPLINEVLDLLVER